MDRATKSEVTRLLKRGLNHYGLGDLEAAIGCWEKARGLDPANQAVKDYLETAYEEAERSGLGVDSADTPPTPSAGPLIGGVDEDDDTPRSLPEVAEPSTGTVATPAPGDPLLERALEAFRTGHLLEAWNDLTTLAERDPDRLDVRGYLELVRKQLMQQWAGEIGDRGRTLRLMLSHEELMKQKLSPEEGFLLAQVDGFVTIDDLISLTNTDRFKTLEMIARFIRQGVLS